MPTLAQLAYFSLVPAAAFALFSLAALDLRTAQGIYLLGGAALITAQLLVAPQVSLAAIVGALVAGEILHFLTVGALGAKLSPNNYGALLAAVGLAPWWMGGNFAAIYTAVGVMGSMVYAHAKFLLARRGLPVKVKTNAEARKKLSPEEFAAFRKKAGVVFSTPLLLLLPLSVFLAR